jgi:hypothetical protein
LPLLVCALSRVIGGLTIGVTPIKNLPPARRKIARVIDGKDWRKGNRPLDDRLAEVHLGRQTGIWSA